MVVDDVVGSSDVVDGEVDEVVARIDVVDEDVDEVVRRVVVVLDTGGVGEGKIVGVGNGVGVGAPVGESICVCAITRPAMYGGPIELSGMLKHTRKKSTEHFFIIGLTRMLCLSNHVNITYYRLQSPGSQQLLFPPVLIFP